MSPLFGSGHSNRNIVGLCGSADNNQNNPLRGYGCGFRNHRAHLKALWAFTTKTMLDAAMAACKPRCTRALRSALALARCRLVLLLIVGNPGLQRRAQTSEMGLKLSRKESLAEERSSSGLAVAFAG